MSLPEDFWEVPTKPKEPTGTPVGRIILREPQHPTRPHHFDMFPVQPLPLPPLLIYMHHPSEDDEAEAEAPVKDRLNPPIPPRPRPFLSWEPSKIPLIPYIPGSDKDPDS